MGLFGKGKITEDLPDNSGLVTIDVKIKQLSRQELEVKITVVEQRSDRAVFNTTYKDTVNKEYFARQRAEELVNMYCRSQNYIPADIIDNIKDVGTLRNTEKRSR